MSTLYFTPRFISILLVTRHIFLQRTYAELAAPSTPNLRASLRLGSVCLALSPRMIRSSGVHDMITMIPYREQHERWAEIKHNDNKKTTVSDRDW